MFRGADGTLSSPRAMVVCARRWCSRRLSSFRADKFETRVMIPIPSAYMSGLTAFLVRHTPRRCIITILGQSGRDSDTGMKEIPKFLHIVVRRERSISSRGADNEPLGQSGWNSARHGAQPELRTRSAQFLKRGDCGTGRPGEKEGRSALLGGRTHAGNGCGMEDAGCSLGRET